MTRYFFHVFNDVHTRDDIGAEFPSIEAARASAVRDARCLAAESIVERGHLILHHRIEIEDGAGAKIDTVQFRDALEVRA